MRRNGSLCKDGLTLDSDECFIAAKRLGYISTTALIEEEEKNTPKGCYVEEYSGIVLVYFNTHQEGSLGKLSRKHWSICKIRNNGRYNKKIKARMEMKDINFFGF